MKALIILLVSIACPCLAIHGKNIACSTDTLIGKITVIGTAERKVPANRAEFAVTIEGYGSTIAESVQDATGQTASLVQLLNMMGVSADKLFTKNFSSGKNSGDKPFLSSRKDYKTTMTTAIIVDSIPILGHIVGTISEMGKSLDGDITFSLQDEQEMIRELRKSATRRAKQKAVDILEELEGRTGTIAFIDETSYKQRSDGDRFVCGTQVRGARTATNAFLISEETTMDPAVLINAFKTPELTLGVRVNITFVIKQ
jgi:uncharacterized protein YggE